MSSRRTPRQLIVAVLVGVLVGGGLLAITPAGAEVSQSVATNWKKIWKKNLKPLADRRYYTKAQSNTKFATKAESAAAAAAAQAAANAATDTKLGGYYTKAQGDAKYAPFPTVIRGTFAVEFEAAGAGDNGADGISFGSNLSAAPTAHLIPEGGPVPADCSGTAANPGASPGHVCVFIAFQSANSTNARLFNGTGGGGASTFGVNTAVTSNAAGSVFYYGTWAVAPAALSAAAKMSPAPAGALEGH